MKKTIVLTVILAFSILQISAQKNPEKSLGAWYMYGGSHKIQGKFSAKTLAHFRFFDMGNDFQQLLIRVGGNYKINKTINATLGYAYFNTDSTFGVDGGEKGESRIYEDINVKHNITKLNLAHRFRFEQRLLEIGLRNLFRYQLAFSYPINKEWSTYLYNEVFLNFSGKTFNQNWAGLGVKYKLSETLKLQLGYMKIHNSKSANFDRIQIGISLNH